MAIQHYDEWERSTAERRLRDALIDAEIDQEQSELKARREMLYRKIWEVTKAPLITLTLGLAVILAVRMAPNWMDPVFQVVDNIIVTLNGN